LQEKIKNSTNEYLVVGIGLNLFKSPKITGYPTTNLFEITNKKINKKLFEKQLKITFEKFLSKYYKTN
jgi:BirA family biotin operon repressor/biotin-[acetyl-CoA-carboxylase] ligase